MFNKPLNRIIKIFLTFSFLLIISLNNIKILAANDYTPSRGDIVINEIAWGGSSLNKTTAPTFYDEWIELYNNTDKEVTLIGFTLYGVGGGAAGIPLSGTILPNNYFLLTKVQTPDLKSAIRIPSNQFSSKLSISNTGFDIILKHQDIEIDRVNAEKVFAGQSTESVKSSMAKVLPLKDGNLKESWESSKGRINFHSKSSNPNIVCGIDYGTPGAVNFTNDPNKEIFEFENSCFEEGDIIKKNSKEYLSISGPKIDEEIMRMPLAFDKEAGSYEVKLNARFEGNNLENKEIGELIIYLNEENKIHFKNISSKYLSNNGAIKIEFLKPENIIEGTLILNSTINPSDNLLLDSFELNRSNPENISILKASDLYSSLAANRIDPSIDRETKYLDKSKIKESEYLIQNNFLSGHINKTKNEALNATYNIKFSNITPGISDNEPVAKLLISNPFSNTDYSKILRKKDIKEDTYQTYINQFITEKIGTNSFEAISYGKADIWLESIKIEPYSNNDSKSIDPSDLKLNEGSNYDANTKSISIRNTTSTIQKAFDHPSNYQCLNSQICEITFEVKIDKYTNPKVGEIYLYSINEDGAKSFRIKHLNSISKDANEFKEYKILLPVSGFSKIGFQSILYPGTEIKVKNIRLNTINNANNNSLEYKSLLQKSWDVPLTLKALNDSKGYKGSLIDIFETQVLETGNFTTKIAIKKKGNLSSSNDLLQISTFDQFGKKLFEESIKENEITMFKNNEFTKSFTLNSPSKVYTSIKFLGNYEEAYSDIEIYKPVLSKK